MKFFLIKLTLVSILFSTMLSCKQEAQKSKDAVTKAVKTAKAALDLSNYSLPGATVLAFGPDNVLFVGDSKSGQILAISTSANANKEPIPFNGHGIDRKIATELGVAPSDLIINDMQIHPASQEAYIAIKNGHAPTAKSLIAIVHPSNNKVRFLDIVNANKTQVAIKNPLTNHFNFYRSTPASSFNITDIDYHDGYIYVAGLTNGEFASTLRKIAYPFKDDQTQVDGIEMWHTVHAQKETRAPIRTMAFEELNGVSTLIAAYTCTPLVSIPTADIKSGNHIKAKTIAELGYGNTPIDMITFMAQEQDGSFDKKLLVINKERSASLISLKDYEKANKGAGLNGFTMGPEGLPIFPVPMSGAMQVAEQNQMMLTVLRRNMATGVVDLISKMKGAYFRLSDFQSEYDFPDHTYRDGEPWVGYHNMMKPMEGYPELVKEK